MLMKTILAIICITALEIVALIKDIDGVLLAASIAAIAGLGGYQIGYRRRKKPKP